MGTASLTGTEFYEPTPTSALPRGPSSDTLRGIIPPETDYSLTPRQCVDSGEPSMSDANGWGDTSTLGAPSIT